MASAAKLRPDPPPTMVLTASTGDLTAEIAQLDDLDLGQLRTQYRNRSGRLAPARISRGLLLRVLAYRLQAERFGDLRPDTRRMLDRLGQKRADDEHGTPSIDVVGQLKPGTMLMREWQGRIEHVMVLGTGFAWQGQSYASLSATALAITGTRWNGYRFFGLPSPGAALPGRSKRSAPIQVPSAESTPPDPRQSAPGRAPEVRS